MCLAIGFRAGLKKSTCWPCIYYTTQPERGRRKWYIYEIFKYISTNVNLIVIIRKLVDDDTAVYYCRNCCLFYLWRNHIYQPVTPQCGWLFLSLSKFECLANFNYKQLCMFERKKEQNYLVRAYFCFTHLTKNLFEPELVASKRRKYIS